MGSSGCSGNIGWCFPLQKEGSETGPCRVYVIFHKVYPLMEDKQGAELLKKIVEEQSWSKSLEMFKENIKALNEVEDLPLSAPTKWGCLMLKILHLRRGIVDKKLNVIKGLGEDLLYEPSIILDFLTSVLINYHFKMNEKAHMVKPAFYFGLLSFHRELGHTNCISVLTNICLKILIRKGKNLYIENNSELVHQGLYFFYTGFLHLVNGRYSEALRDLKHSTILRSSLATEAYIVVASLLSNECYRPRKYKKLHPYIELKKAVEEGSLEDFGRVLEKHKPSFEKHMLFEVIKRLRSNVADQNLKKIKKVYSKIRVSTLLEMNVRPDMIDTGAEVVTFPATEKAHLDISSRIFESEDLISKIKSMMRYNEIEPLCYETVAKKLDR